MKQSLLVTCHMPNTRNFLCVPLTRPGSLSQALRKNRISTMATRKHYNISQEQLALAKARKEKKMNKVLVTKDSGTPQLLSRRWLSLPHALNLEHPEKSRYHQVKIMTWNVCRLLLATCIFTESLL